MGLAIKGHNAALCHPFLLTLFLCSSIGFPQAAASLRAHLPAPAWGPPRAAGANLLHHGPLHELWENLCSGAYSTSCPSFSFSLWRVGLFLRLSSLPPGTAQWVLTFSQTCFHRGATSFSDGLSFGQWWVCCSWLCPAQCSAWPLLTEVTPTAPHYQNLATLIQYRSKSLYYLHLQYFG